MKHILYLFGIALLLSWQPAIAQDGCDDEIEIGEDDGEESGLDEEELKKIRKKNSGLGGQDDNDDDADAPKVKGSLQERINKAIADGVAWLKKKQAKDGSWPPVTANRDYKTGKVHKKPQIRDELAPSAWSVYALAKCGVKKSDPVIKKGLKYIFDQTKFTFDELGGKPDEGRDRSQPQRPSRNSARILSTYESAAIVMMIEAVYEKSAKLTKKHKKRRLYTKNPLKVPTGSKIPKDVWKYMHNRILHLTVGRRGTPKKGRTIPGTQVPNGKNKGGWRYGQGTGGDADLSATQFVLLALRAASQAGYPVERVSRDVWRNAAEYTKKCQKSDGGFSYQIPSSKVTGAMTACGVGCLVICKEQIELAREHDPELPAPPAWIDGAIEKGLVWLDQNFTPQGNPGGNHHFYYLYGVERVGDLTGRSEFNGLNWYVRGAEFLLGNQDPDGHWLDGTEGFPPKDVNSTTLALLFLKRATPPVVTYRDPEPGPKR